MNRVAKLGGSTYYCQPVTDGAQNTGGTSNGNWQCGMDSKKDEYNDWTLVNSKKYGFLLNQSKLPLSSPTYTSPSCVICKGDSHASNY